MPDYEGDRPLSAFCSSIDECLKPLVGTNRVEVCIGFSHIFVPSIFRYRLLQVRDSSFHISTQTIETGFVVPGIGIVWINFEGTVEARSRLFRAAQVPQGSLRSNVGALSLGVGGLRSVRGGPSSDSGALRSSFRGLRSSFRGLRSSFRGLRSISRGLRSI